jgi:hypothetical protein
VQHWDEVVTAPVLSRVARRLCVVTAHSCLVLVNGCTEERRRGPPSRINHVLSFSFYLSTARLPCPDAEHCRQRRDSMRHVAAARLSRSRQSLARPPPLIAPYPEVPVIALSVSTVATEQMPCTTFLLPSLYIQSFGIFCHRGLVHLLARFQLNKRIPQLSFPFRTFVCTVP